MRRRKRLLIAATMLVVVLAAGYSSSGSSSNTRGSSGSIETCTTADPCTIRFWPESSSAAYKKVIEPMIAAFNKSHPGVTVEIRYATTEYRTIIRQAFSSGNPPEIMEQEGYTDVFDYVEKKQLLDITDWVKARKGRFASATLPSVQLNGKYWGVPAYVALTNTVWYNKKILAANGINPAKLKTWNLMLAAFAKLKSAGITPLAYGAKDGWPGSEWYFSFFGKLAGGAHLMQLSAGNCGYKWTDPVSVKAAQMYIDLNDKGYFTPGAAGRDWNASNAEFLAGKAGFYAMGTWLITYVLQPAKNKNDFGLITFPNVPGGKGGQSTQLIAPGGYALTYSAKDPAKRAASLAWLDTYTSVKNQKALNRVTGVISSVPAANTPDALDHWSRQVVKEQLLKATNPYTFLEHVTTIATGEEAIWKGSIGALTGQKTALSWMQSVQKADDRTKGQNTYKVAPRCS